MNKSFDEQLDSYADLLVQVGVNVQPGQKLVVRADIAAAPLVRSVARAAYQAGSPYVEVMWSDEGVTRTRFTTAPADSFSQIPAWRAEAILKLAQEGAASLAITSDDPNLLSGVAPENISTYLKEWRAANRAYSEIAMRDGVAWCVAAAASPAWARLTFPDLSEDEAVERLWAAIFTATRADLADPVTAWRGHTAELARLKGRLNGSRYAALRFRAPGTDLRVGLADGHLWDGGVSRTPDGTEFVANMPTEEVFTAPHRERIDGTVRASMPLAYNGTIIDDFELTFEDGRVTDFRAGKGEEELRNILDTDDGARSLGEVALVPVTSPIAKAGVLFLNTLFDENAACHLALGKGYAMTVEGAAGMSEEEARATGLNDSLVHVDFMIGSAEMDIDGENADGSLEPIMRAGHLV